MRLVAALGDLATPEALLGVSASIAGLRWRATLDRAGDALALHIAQTTGLGDVESRLLAARGIPADSVASFLNPAVRDLMPDPSVVTDMDAAVIRLADAMEARLVIGIFGDYDVDGASSAALLATYLRSCGVEFRIHIPDRLFEGFGPNVEAVRALAADKVGLLVTVDCGTTSPEAIAEASRLGLGPVIFDHHQAPEHLPDALVVNANRLDDLSGLGSLCAAGIVFVALVALQRELRRRGYFGGRTEPDLLASLDLVALATVADVAPLTGLNRAFVKKGLAVMQAGSRAGLAALFDVAGGLGPPDPYHLGFLLGPRINAGGRIGDAALGARLLMEDDADAAASIASTLDRLNRERQTIEAGMLEEAEADALRQVGLHDDGAAVIVVSGKRWHQGIVGIIAGRLRERFNRPAFAIALQGAGGTGSGRSLPGVDLGRAVRAAVEAGVLRKGGGHAMAAGVTLGEDGIEAFRSFIVDALTAQSEAARQDHALSIDATLTASAATPALLAAIAKVGPFGSASPEPLFAFPAHRVVESALVGTDHVRLRLEDGRGTSLDGISFRSATSELGRALLTSRGQSLHVAGTLMLDRFNGRERVRLRVRDAAPPTRPTG